MSDTLQFVAGPAIDKLKRIGHLHQLTRAFATESNGATRDQKNLAEENKQLLVAFTGKSN
jgi:hypothetical protein